MHTGRCTPQTSGLLYSTVILLPLVVDIISSPLATAHILAASVFGPLFILADRFSCVYTACSTLTYVYDSIFAVDSQITQYV